VQPGKWTRSGAGIGAVLVLITACSSAPATQPSASVPTTSRVSIASAPSATPPSTTISRPTRRPATTAAPAPTQPAPTRTPIPRTSLPLGFRTGTATQVITAVAASSASTEGTLQAWRKVSGGWRKVGVAVHAWFGSDGLTRRPSETRSATPIGSFTLTRAFGRYADPGTALPYTRTTPADWWISESGPLYNTMQRCSTDCPFTLGDPNEHLYYTTPYYRYAVVIDYNTRNSPTGVVQGAGSAFFLHVTVGEPTQGCISISQHQLVRLLRWLSPADYPRILIGIA
jgi:L,D-peptidoglycan transpeptidase YkuD (ErfK/YbiS/YcfS/YnhG family)